MIMSISERTCENERKEKGGGLTLSGATTTDSLSLKTSVSIGKLKDLDYGLGSTRRQSTNSETCNIGKLIVSGLYPAHND